MEAEDGKKPDEERELLRGGCCGGLGEGRRKEGSWLSRREVARRGRQPHPASTTATWRHRPTGNCRLPPRRALADDDDDIVRCGRVVAGGPSWLSGACGSVRDGDDGAGEGRKGSGRRRFLYARSG